jgi:uncharacterized protein (TIGR00251 family)
MKTIQVRVKPGARISSLEAQADGTWLARVKAPPVDGKANKELVGLVAQHFKRTKSQVSVRAGASGRVKLVQIQDQD